MPERYLSAPKLIVPMPFPLTRFVILPAVFSSIDFTFILNIFVIIMARVSVREYHVLFFAKKTKKTPPNKKNDPANINIVPDKTNKNVSGLCDPRYIRKAACSQKNAKPQNTKLKGITIMSLKWKITLGSGLPDHKSFSPGASLGAIISPSI